MTNLLTVKLRRDLRASWPRFALMVIAFAVSLTVFGGMLFGWATTGRETSGAYMSTEPASATVVLEQGIDAERMAAIAAKARTRPQVIEATGRTQFTGDVQVNGQPRNVQLQAFAAAPDDTMRMVKFDLGRPGSWPPATGEILLGDDGSLSLLGAAVGDTITIQAPGGRPVRLRVAGTVYDPSLAPSPQEQRGHGYVSTASLATSGPPVLLDQLKIQVADPGQTVPTRDRATVDAVAGAVAAWLQRDYGLTIAEIQVPKPYAHPHQWQADVLGLSLLSGGAAALLLAGILVATMLNNLFTQQIPQIGIMKAIGARSVRIGRLYLVMTLLVAATATALAVGPARWLGRDRVQGLLGMLGIQPASLVPPWWTYLVVVAGGLGLPPLLALLPLIKASRITVRAAIDHHGGAAKPSAATGLLARLGRLRRSGSWSRSTLPPAPAARSLRGRLVPRRPLRSLGSSPLLDRGLVMALRNTVRRPARFWLSVGLLATAGMVFVAGMSLRSSTQAADQQRIEQRYWDAEAELAAPAQQDAVAAAVRQVPGISRLETWYRTQIGVAGPGRLPLTRTYPDQGHGSVSLNAVPPDVTLPPPTLREGRWLGTGETGAVVLNQTIRNRAVPGLGAGDTVQLFIDGKPTTWRIVGVVEEGDAGGRGAYTTPEGLAAATGRQPRQVNQLRVITDRHDERTRQTAADDIDEALTGAGIEVDSAASVSRGTAASSAHLGPVLMVLLGVALPLGVLGAIGLASTMSANILDRTREFGIMHAIGARPKMVRRIVVAEGVFLAVTSCLVAAIPALVLTKVLGTGLGNLFGDMPLPFRISTLGVAIWIALVILGAILATDAAATRASRITVRQALTYL
jgi:putative ABC transport system permease protein